MTKNVLKQQVISFSVTLFSLTMPTRRSQNFPHVPSYGMVPILVAVFGLKYWHYDIEQRLSDVPQSR